MDKIQLKKLQAERIMTMAQIYRAVDLDPADVGTKLSRISLNFPQKWLDNIEKELMDQISEVVAITDMPLDQLIPRLIANLDSHLDQRAVFDHMDAAEVEPIAYITTKTERVLAVYLPRDKYRPRSSKYDEAVPTYMTFKQLFDKGEKNIDLTGRGLEYAQEQTKNLA
jgi:hypothetical protein